MTTVDPEDSIARLWSVLRCRNGQVVHQCWAQPHDSTELRALDGDIELALDEIERLQTENDRLLDLLATTTLALIQAGGG